jgi:hypothetical protein
VTIERLLEAGRALDAGELGRAERIYRQVATSDPQSSIAVVGLARVALQRGAVEEALGLAQSALSIDPGNIAARRLVEDDLAARLRVDATRRPPHEAPGGDAAQPAPGGTRETAVDGRPAAEWPRPDAQEPPAGGRRGAPGLLARLLRRGRG